MSEENKDTDAILGSPAFPVRFSFTHFFTPVEDEDKINKKTGKPDAFYSCQIIIDKNDEASIDAINEMVKRAAAVKLGDKKIPSTWKLPLRDGDEEWEEKESPHLKGCYFFNCKTKTKPGVVGTRKATEEDVEAWEMEHDMEDERWKAKNRPKVGKLLPLLEDEIKSGDYGRVAVNFYYFEGESKGVAVGLNNVQKLKDGEALGSSRKSADEAFGDLDDGFSD